VLLIDGAAGGRTRFSQDGYIEGAPELVAEIAASSAAIDLGDKKQVYLRNGVQEYLVWQVFEQRLDWFCLQDGAYISLSSVMQAQFASASFRDSGWRCRICS
jgi:Uma2 family endonuclease